jgi:hypothetical protein
VAGFGISGVEYTESITRKRERKEKEKERRCIVILRKFRKNIHIAIHIKNIL